MLQRVVNTILCHSTCHGGTVFLNSAVGISHGNTDPAAFSMGRSLGLSPDALAVSFRNRETFKEEIPFRWLCCFPSELLPRCHLHGQNKCNGRCRSCGIFSISESGSMCTRNFVIGVSAGIFTAEFGDINHRNLSAFYRIQTGQEPVKQDRVLDSKWCLGPAFTERSTVSLHCRFGTVEVEQLIIHVDVCAAAIHSHQMEGLRFPRWASWLWYGRC